MHPKNHMAVDQYGHTYHNLGPQPRKELLARLGRKRASKMFVDNDEGKSLHIGWIINRFWLTVFEVKRIDRE